MKREHPNQGYHYNTNQYSNTIEPSLSTDIISIIKEDEKEQLYNYSFVKNVSLDNMTITSEEYNLALLYFNDLSEKERLLNHFNEIVIPRFLKQYPKFTLPLNFNIYKQILFKRFMIAKTDYDFLNPFEVLKPINTRLLLKYGKLKYKKAINWFERLKKGKEIIFEEFDHYYWPAYKEKYYYLIFILNRERIRQIKQLFFLLIILKNFLKRTKEKQNQKEPKMITEWDEHHNRWITREEVSTDELDEVPFRSFIEDLEDNPEYTHSGDEFNEDYYFYDQ